MGEYSLYALFSVGLIELVSLCGDDGKGKLGIDEIFKHHVIVLCKAHLEIDKQEEEDICIERKIFVDKLLPFVALVERTLGIAIARKVNEIYGIVNVVCVYGDRLARFCADTCQRFAV